MPTTEIVAAWRPGSVNPFRTGISLHSHTSHSRETLDFIPRFASSCAPLAAMLRRYEARYLRLHGRPLNYADAWWTPPLGPREALTVERRQLENLGLDPLVSLTDHDSVEAPLLLRVLPEGRETPVGVEWSVPFRGVEFHLGLHNLPARHAAGLMAELQQFTANPQEFRLPGLLDWVAESPDTLIVFNHPHWDEKGHGQRLFDQRAAEFLRIHRPWLHALEANGLRPWSENRRTLDLGRREGLPVVAGGDRHCLEPNALVNLSLAPSFSEFVSEVRDEGRSTVALMEQYREPLLGRILRSIADVMRDNDAHTYGWRRWSDRVFFTRASGETAALSEAFPEGREPSLVRLFVFLARTLDHGSLQAALRGPRQAPEIEW